MLFKPGFCGGKALIMREKKALIIMEKKALIIVIAGLALGTLSSQAAGTMYGGVGNGSGVNSGALLAVDQITGAGTLIGDPVTPGGLSGLDFDAGGSLWGSTILGFGSASSLVKIDPGTGALISTIGPITETAVPISIGDLAFDPISGKMFGIQSNADALGGGGKLYTIDLGTGAATLVGDTGAGAGGGIAFAPDGTLYQASFHSAFDFLSLNTLDPSDASPITSVALLRYFDGLAVRPDGTIFGATGGADGIYTIDALTGGDTLLGATGRGKVSDLAFDRTAVPDQTSTVLTAATLAGLLALQRRRHIGAAVGG
jgi:sugar lactone lactonase YvrE